MKRLFICLTLLSALAAPVAAQTSITSTTLSAAVSAPAPTGQFTITVGSATGMAANGILYIDGAVYRIVSVSGTTIRVQTVDRPSTHLTSANVYVVPLAAQIAVDPVGSCLRSTAGSFPAYSPYTLMFNLTNGHIAVCRGAAGSRTWQIVSPYAVQLSGTPPQTP